MNYLGHINEHDPRKDVIESDLQEFENLVQFTLDKFEVNANFRVIYVFFKEWNRYHISSHIYQIWRRWMIQYGQDCPWVLFPPM